MRNLLGKAALAASVLLFLLACSKGRPAGLERVSTIRPDLSDIQAYETSVRAELAENILPFWIKNAPDPKNGGFYGRVEDDLSVDASAPRGVLLDARILWTFSAAYLSTGRRYNLDMADKAYSDLQSRFSDRTNGGYFWATRADGTVSDPRKILYAQAFVIYALAEYHRATGSPEALQCAQDLYRLIGEKCRDKVNGGYFEEFDTAWTPLRNRGEKSSALGAPDQKSQNAHLHMMEAFTSLYRVWPDKALAVDIAALQDLMLDKVLNGATHHLGLYFSDDWKCSSKEISFGHDIEFSWLVCESAAVLGDRARIARARKTAVEIALAVAAEGVDSDGGLYNEGLPDGTISDDNKDWWPQAEAAVGFLNAWRISGDPRFFRLSEASWSFIRFHVSDAKGTGEWFGRLDRKGRPVPGFGKISFWKCPYHNGRACMEIAEMLNEAGDSSVR